MRLKANLVFFIFFLSLSFSRADAAPSEDNIILNITPILASASNISQDFNISGCWKIYNSQTQNPYDGQLDLLSLIDNNGQISGVFKTGVATVVSGQRNGKEVNVEFSRPQKIYSTGIISKDHMSGTWIDERKDNGTWLGEKDNSSNCQ